MPRYGTNVEVILADMETDPELDKYRFQSSFFHPQKEELFKTGLPANLRAKNLKRKNKKRKGG
ncbi:hypothetical protein KJ586_02475 [Patescibacteria group bacterium]|nr:hypothetical protein [Patescibacteria group bacterium]MBU4347295.1 hypothetical protein [Patescibacteria group bacterium]MBU4455351.1 hypothetical protein [Patescibacteria group bacterium]MCG2690879.1 hypothetical protein [Candidatus Parcubacteria bacterium]